MATTHPANDCLVRLGDAKGGKHEAARLARLKDLENLVTTRGFFLGKRKFEDEIRLHVDVHDGT